MSDRTPAQIRRWLQEHSHELDQSVQYLGDEPNAVGRPWDQATVRWLLMAAWIYENAAGNQSIPAVYKTINDHRPDFLCDRFYLPATPRDLKKLERDNIPVFGIESKHQLKDFDVVGTSISYPVLSMSFVKMLKMSGIPIRWRDRDPNTHPMVMVGGLSYGAPEVLAPVVDCWFLGEVEDEPDNPGIGAVTASIAGFKASRRWTTDRLGCYRDLARQYNFLYFPRFVDVLYGHVDRSHLGLLRPSKQVVGYTSNLEGMRLPFRKRHVRNLDAVAPLDNPPLLYADPAMGSGDLEVGRGCPAWCSFCALTYRQKPYRQRSVESTVEFAKTFQDNMGSTRMAPFMPDMPMHTRRRTLIRSLLENVSDEVDAPSMRVDDFIADQQYVLLQVSGGMDSVTLGVEGNSQRMRDLVGKGVTDEDIKEAVTRGIRAGIRKFKLFMITNLPGEDEGDVIRSLKLAKDLADIRENLRQPTVRIQFSWTPLIIEANTPLQWFAPTPPNRVLADVFDAFRDLKIDFKIGAKGEENKAAFFQLCQRASRDVGEALVDAMDETDTACWGGVPRSFKTLLESKLHEHGFANGYADCFDERQLTDMFGWEFIDQGINVSLMWKTYLQMREFVELTDSHTYDQYFDGTYHGSEWVERCDSRCQGKQCGVCTYGDLKIRQGYLQAAKLETDVDLTSVRPVNQRTQVRRVRVRVVKPEPYRFVSNDHWRFNVRRAAFRAQRILRYDAGIAKRSIRFASDEIKHGDFTCGVDYIEFGMTGLLSTVQMHDFLACMNEQLGDWMHLHPSQYLTLSPKSLTLRSDVDLSLFELDVADLPTSVLERIEDWNTATHVPMRLRIEAGYFAPTSEEVNAKTYVEQLWAVRNGHRLALRMLIRGRPTPYNIWAALMRRPSWRDAARRPAVRLEAFLKADRDQQDFIRPNCVDCGYQIPTTVLDEPYHPQRCPMCLDRHDGIVIERADLRRNPMTDQPELIADPIAAEVETDEGADGVSNPDPSNTPIYKLVEPLDHDDDTPAQLMQIDPGQPLQLHDDTADDTADDNDGRGPDQVSADQADERAGH